MVNSLSFNFFILFFLFSLTLAIFFVKNSRNILKGQLLDKDFSKPQAFHDIPVARLGGVIFIILFLTFIFFYNKILNIFLIDYLIISTFFFILGFLDDLKIKINPNSRLILMIIILLFIVLETCYYIYGPMGVLVFVLTAL